MIDVIPCTGLTTEWQTKPNISTSYGDWFMMLLFVAWCLNISQSVNTLKSQLTAYETKYKREQKRSNLPNGIKFLIDLIENNFEGAVRQDDKITAKSLSLCFREWCTNNGTKFNLNALKSQIKRLGVEDGKNGRVQGTVSKCYVINVDDMRTNFREFLKYPKFDFDIMEVSDDSDEEQQNI